MAFFNPLTEVAGYREAVEAETRGRDIPWLGLTETVNGIEVLQFTPQHFITLSLISSPFISGGHTTPEEVARFLWVVSPGFTQGNSVRTRAKRWRFVSRCRKLKLLETSKAITRYIDDAFSDSSSDTTKQSKSYFSCIAGIVDSIASEYGWSERAILEMPFKKLFQLFKAINMRYDPKAKPCNASQRLISEHLMKQNAAAENLN
jgi:hypothetical protein